MSILVEPGSQFFRVKDEKGFLHRFSSYLLQEAESGDGVLFPEEVAKNQHHLPVKEVRPWGRSGEILELSGARLYLTLLRRRFRSLFRRADWAFILSPRLVKGQEAIWNLILKEAGFRRYCLLKNLERHPEIETRDQSALFLHWGTGGGDLGCCFQNRLFRYQWISTGEGRLLQDFHEKLNATVEEKISTREAYRVFTLMGVLGLKVSSGQMVEIDCSLGTGHERKSLPHDILLASLLEALMPVLSEVEDFVRSLGAHDHNDLFATGLKISGGGTLSPLLGQVLQQFFEFPVSLRETSQWSVINQAH